LACWWSAQAAITVLGAFRFCIGRAHPHHDYLFPFLSALPGASLVVLIWLSFNCLTASPLCVVAAGGGIAFFAHIGSFVAGISAFILHTC
jgi:hypothetical protein